MMKFLPWLGLAVSMIKASELDEKITEIFGLVDTNAYGSAEDLDQKKVENILLDIETTDVNSKYENCSDYTEEFGYECVPYYQCEDGLILTDQEFGIGLIDKRIDLNVVDLDPEGSKCPHYLDVCCKNPNFSPPSPPQIKYSPKCGRRNIDGLGVRIQGFKESEAQFGEWPHMCAILHEKLLEESAGYDEEPQTVNLYQCGGSLIGPGTVLTAAHCVDNFLNSKVKLKIRCGEWDTQNETEPFPHQDRYVETIKIHPEFNDKNLHNDFAVVFTKLDFNLSSHIDTICLPESNYMNFNKSNCFATGWGKDKFGSKGEYQVVLKEIDLPIVENKQCQDLLRKTKLGKKFKLDDSFMCAGGINGKDTCHGDGGGPLVCESTSFPDTYVQTGIVSWGVGCGEDGTPGVYASVIENVCWIDYVTSCHLGGTTGNFSSILELGSHDCGKWLVKTREHLKNMRETVAKHIVPIIDAKIAEFDKCDVTWLTLPQKESVENGSKIDPNASNFSETDFLSEDDIVETTKPNLDSKETQKQEDSEEKGITKLPNGNAQNEDKDINSIVTNDGSISVEENNLQDVREISESEHTSTLSDKENEETTIIYDESLNTEKEKTKIPSEELENETLPSVQEQNENGENVLDKIESKEESTTIVSLADGENYEEFGKDITKIGEANLPNDFVAGNEDTALVEVNHEFKNCEEYTEKYGYECVPYYQCHNGTIITDGAGLIDIRNGFSTLAPEDSKCPGFLDVCCKDPDFIPPPAAQIKYSPKCGQRNQNGLGVRIQGFVEAESQFGEWPHMCAILHEKPIEQEAGYGGEPQTVNLYQCGGSLIAPGTILTAAHCVDKFRQNPTELKIRCGEWDTQNQTEPYPHQDRYVKSLDIHPEFNGRNLQNDFAVLFTSQDFVLANHIDTVCLPQADEIFDGTTCFATGWGKDKFGSAGQYQVVLKEIDLPIVNNYECQDKLRQTRLGQKYRLHDSFICAGGVNGKDTCKGDGGSPLVCPSKYDPDTYVQAGMVAWGIGCGEDGTPGVYASVSKALCWIDYAMSCHYGASTGDYNSYNGYTSNVCQEWIDRKVTDLERKRDEAGKYGRIFEAQIKSFSQCKVIWKEVNSSEQISSYN